MAEQTGPSFVRHLERLTGGTAYVCSYGSSETGTTAVTCRERNLHLQTQSYLLELHDDTGTRPVDGSADRGELVVTTLDLPARPLLRYRTGDRVEITGETCACGVRTRCCARWAGSRTSWRSPATGCARTTWRRHCGPRSCPGTPSSTTCWWYAIAVWCCW